MLSNTTQFLLVDKFAWKKIFNVSIFCLLLLVKCCVVEGYANDGNMSCSLQCRKFCQCRVHMKANQQYQLYLFFQYKKWKWPNCVSCVGSKIANQCKFIMLYMYVIIFLGKLYNVQKVQFSVWIIGALSAPQDSHIMTVNTDRSRAHFIFAIFWTQ